jgi:hypothetical protein
VAVAQGFDPSVGWEALAEGAAAIRDGAWWVASNLDMTFPTPDGPAPGNGALVYAVAAAVGRRPDLVAGKPDRPLFDETVRRVQARRPLVVGDRLDTDIEGANRCGADSLLVMTGVTDVPTLLQAPPNQRATYVAWTMSGLLSSHQAPRADTASAAGPAGAPWQLNGWAAHVDGGRVLVDRRGADPDDGLRVAVAAAWAWQDDHGTSVTAVEGLEADR